MDGGALVRAVLAACLDQVLGNASEVATGHGSADHIHQLRVGIRRLRTALRELEGVGAPFDPAWEPALVEAFRALGRHRDHSHLGREVEPVLQAAGGPAVDVASAAGEVPDPVATVRAPAFQGALLGLLEYAHAEDAGPTLQPKAARKAIRRRLQKLHARVLDDGERFTTLDEAAQHRVRKRCKRLRYLLEFTAPLMRPRRLEAFLGGLKPVQAALGTYNDELVALAAYRERAATQPDAWFGVGWLTARKPVNAAACLQALQQLARLPPPWK